MFPAVSEGEATLRELVHEFKTRGRGLPADSADDSERVVHQPLPARADQAAGRAGVPFLQPRHRPVIEALALVARYANAGNTRVVRCRPVWRSEPGTFWSVTAAVDLMFSQVRATAGPGWGMGAATVIMKLCDETSRDGGRGGEDSQEWAGAFGAAMGAIADCFKRREPRQAAAELTSGLLMELEIRNCWTLAEAAGHRSPDRFQHLLARAKFDHEAARRKISEQVAVHLAGEEIVLVADETGDEKASEYAVGAAHQYSGAIGGTAKCQVAVHLVAVTARMRVMIDRKLYLAPGVGGRRRAP